MNTTAAKAAYLAGWKSGQTPSFAKVAAADKRRAPAAWYLGFFDAEAGREKFASLTA